MGATKSAPLLSVDGLTVEFSTRAGSVRPLDGITFDIARGETVALLGESGSGKSVTAQAVMGLLPQPAGRITSGRITFDGEELTAMSPEKVRALCGTRIAMIFQDPLSSLNPVFRIGSQVAEPLRRRLGMRKPDAMRRALELLRRVGIPDAERRMHHYPHQFSGGQRQRIMIAMALALDPDLLIADEPTTALDVTVQAQIMQLLSDLQAEHGMAILLITHDLGVVADAASRAVVLYAGRVAEEGRIRDVYDNSAHPYTEGLLASIPQADHGGGQLRSITGAPPNPLTFPQGCRFHPRCPYAQERCRDERPELRHPTGWASDQAASCHFTEEVLQHG
ncbi:ABC transporter ATP-binding protein [Ruania alkalisoli]|uniref:ABC transporter ATP-binding protein n=1 Tax=Ruania alkalisoli TaxID=2779775 RepID=A0A7M1SRW0_9MICO|nr:ABC transporter ATP-binding protein [Ruania alkalisoli]QOR69512.1 ABC transporter ATP-binding protein [Ruania alkalisoli]